ARKIRTIVNKAVPNRAAVTQKTTERLGDAVIGLLSARLALSELREKGYIEALNNEKKKRKRSKLFTEEFRAEEGSGAIFFSPSKVKKARDVQDAKEAAKEQETQDKLLKAQDRAVQKAYKELEAQQKRKDRAARAVAREADEALKKVQKDKQKEAKRAQKQLETESKALDRRSRRRPARQKV
ncbi:hypothetical protein LTR28_006768, partial [Elasticomyces elasticus]